MADVNSSIFNTKAAEKLRSPDDLDKYVRVTNPSVWVIIAACAALLAGLLAWGVFGAVTTNVSATATRLEDGSVVCFMTADKVAEVSVGDYANVGGKSMSVSSISSLPLSRDEAKGVLANDYLVSTLLEGDWAYAVYFTSDEDIDFAVGYPVSAVITTERVAPIALILGGKV